MGLDDDLLRAARRSGERAADAQRAADIAKADYHHAIRRLQLSGATMREVAAALNLSHQRVQQIVDANGGGRRWRRAKPSGTDTRACSFCGTDQRKVKKLVSGPGVFICERCVATARRVARVEPGQLGRVGRLVSVDAPDTRCGFCGKARRDVNALVATPEHPGAPAGPGKYGSASICTECLDLCAEIVKQEGRG